MKDFHFAAIMVFLSPAEDYGLCRVCDLSLAFFAVLKRECVLQYIPREAIWHCGIALKIALKDIFRKEGFVLTFFSIDISCFDYAMNAGG